ncbi:MAG: bifunctional nuclease family protein [Armatimonadota bacterium]
MQDDERRRRYGEDPEEEPEGFYEEQEEPVDEEDELRRLLGEAPGFDDELDEVPPYHRGRELEVRITGVYERQEPGQPRYTLVELRDNYGRRVPILIGQFEAYSIAMALSGTAPQRPLTHDLMRNILDRLGARVDRVVIDDLWRETFYAKIFLVVRKNLEDEEEIEIDARPSDAIAMAVRFNAPIYMSEAVLEAAGLSEDYS